ncbi:MAG: ABC transporter permease [Bacteroidales bacterium]|nr:ABC transporter permease [Bacteroidales bacterium]
MAGRVRDFFRDALSIFSRELKLLVTDGGVMIIFVVAGFLYPLLYNYIYKNGVLEETPVAVVDNSCSSLSRRFIREIDATREVHITQHCADMNEARELFRDRKVNGIIYIPADFDDAVAREETARFSIYADMSSFLYYKNLLIGSEFVMLQEINNIKVERYAFDGMTDQEADQSVYSVRYDENNPYNRAFSYSIFLISAILMLIIQQVMFYGMSLAAGTMREENRSFATLPGTMRGRGVGRIVLGRGLVYWLMFVAIGLWITTVVPAIFKFPQRGDFWDIAYLVCIFVTDCVFFSMTWSTFVTRRESVFLLLLFVSPVCVFLTGCSWPSCAFPTFWKYFSYLFPGTFGARAFINMNTAGADLVSELDLIRALHIQTIVYFITACVAVYLENFVIRHRDEINRAIIEAHTRRHERIQEHGERLAERLKQIRKS